MSQSTMTPHIAPRDLEQLVKLSAYALRALAEQVGALASDAQKMAWHGMNGHQRASEIGRLLTVWDQQNPGVYQGGAPPAPAAGPATVQIPTIISQPMLPVGIPIPGVNGKAHGAAAMQQHLPMGVPIPGLPNGIPGGPPHVTPAAIATAQQAATPTTGKGKRAPQATPAAAPLPPPVAPQAAAQPPNPELALNFLTHLNRIDVATLDLGKALEGVASKAASVEGQQKELWNAVQGMNQSLQSMQQMLVWLTLMNVSTVATQQGVSPVEALSMAIGDAGVFEQLVAQASGK